MSGCSVFALDKCFAGLFAGWMPDWLAPLLPYWWVAGLLVGGGLAWRLAGVPGITAFAAAVGFILGRRSVEPHEHFVGKDAAPPAPKPRHRTVLLDEFNRIKKK